MQDRSTEVLVTSRGTDTLQSTTNHNKSHYGANPSSINDSLIAPEIRILHNGGGHQGDADLLYEDVENSNDYVVSHEMLENMNRIDDDLGSQDDENKQVYAMPNLKHKVLSQDTVIFENSLYGTIDAEGGVHLPDVIAGRNN